MGPPTGDRAPATPARVPEADQTDAEEHCGRGLRHGQGDVARRRYADDEVDRVVVRIHVGEEPREARARRAVFSGVAFSREYVVGPEHPVAHGIENARIGRQQADRVGPVLEVEFHSYGALKLKEFNGLPDIELCC